MKLVTALISLLFWASCRTAPAPVPAFGPGTDELIKRSNELDRAVFQKDAPTVRSLIAPEFTLNFVARNVQGLLLNTPYTPPGQWIVKAFERIQHGPLEWVLLDARVFEDAGVVTKQYRKAAMENQPPTLEGHITEIWIRKDERWRVLSSTVSVFESRP